MDFGQTTKPNSSIESVNFQVQACQAPLSGFGFTLPAANSTDADGNLVPTVAIPNASLIVNMTYVGTFDNASFAISGCGTRGLSFKSERSPVAEFSGSLPDVGALFVVPGQCIYFEIVLYDAENCNATDQTMVMDVALIGDFCKNAPRDTKECKGYDPQVTMPPKTVNGANGSGSSAPSSTPSHAATLTRRNVRHVLLSLTLSALAIVVASA